MNSYNVINYKIRPQKQIERSLMAVLINDFTRLIGKKINYIGMGSLLFVDFSFFNKNCQLNKMISIEKMTKDDGSFDYQKEKRFINNKPLVNIELWTKSVTDAIEDMPLDENGFIWLDYDEQIEPATIDDLERIIEKTTATCLLAITFNGGTHKRYKSQREVNLELCEKEYKPYRVEDANDEIVAFTKDNYGQVASSICEKYIMEKVSFYNENYGRNMSMNRISIIKYNDNAKMTTYLWGIFNEDDPQTNVLKEKFDKFEGAGELNLSMESLTLYEKMRLDRCIPDEKEKLIIEMGLDPKSVETYYKYAKYIPEYSEIYI